MIKLYVWKTPNGYKIPVMLEELAAAGKPLEYELIPINISKGDQKTPEFLAINPNGKIPALIDEDAEGGPITIFESGAILQYLAEKSGMLMTQDLHGKYLVLEWLMFQMAGVGPMIGQLGHFTRFAPEPVPYAIERYTSEVKRLLGVLDHRLGEVEFLAGEYSIADISTWTWLRMMKGNDAVSFDEHKNVVRWVDAIAARPGAQKGIEKVDAACVS